MSEARVYAVAVELHEFDGDKVSEVRRVLEGFGFRWRQGSTYFGGAAVNAVTSVMAALELGRTLPWFAASVRDIRMLRIEEDNDLMPVVQCYTGVLKKGMLC